MIAGLCVPIARRMGLDRVVTVAMQAVEFKLPVYVGDTVSFYGETVRVPL